jgi:hypothetical protein
MFLVQCSFKSVFMLQTANCDAGEDSPVVRVMTVTLLRGGLRKLDGGGGECSLKSPWGGG